MNRHSIELQIEKADLAIATDDLDTLLNIYTDDAVLVIEPGNNAIGKAEILTAVIGAYDTTH